MAEYIPREAVIDLITRRYENPEICTQEINQIPSADVAPVVHGRWDKCGATRHKNHCTRCGSERPYRKIGRGYYLVWDSPYCPHCGAKMDGGEKDAKVPT